MSDTSISASDQVSCLDIGSLHAMAGNKHISEAKKMEELGRQLEAALIKPIIKSAMEPTFDGFLEKSPGSSGYTQLATDLLAESITKASPFGISHVLQTQMKPYIEKSDD